MHNYTDLSGTYTTYNLRTQHWLHIHNRGEVKPKTIEQSTTSHRFMWHIHHI